MSWSKKTQVRWSDLQQGVPGRTLHMTSAEVAPPCSFGLLILRSLVVRSIFHHSLLGNQGARSVTRRRCIRKQFHRRVASELVTELMGVTAVGVRAVGVGELMGMAAVGVRAVGVGAVGVRAELVGVTVGPTSKCCHC
jgi:hypothetical protein